jgi:recombination protein RecR
MLYSSKLIEVAVNEMVSLPGIGKKSALRLVLFLLKAKPEQTERLVAALRSLRTQIRYCQRCHNVADADLCNVCMGKYRDAAIICVVENIQDIIAIENTGQYKGLYHVLGGVISPVEGIGPEHIAVDSLIARIQVEKPEEIIFALRATIEGDTTAFYITKKVKGYPIKLTSIARGVAVGSELEYTDEMTLGQSIKERIAYH